MTESGVVSRLLAAALAVAAAAGYVAPRAAAQQPPGPVITSPAEGQVLQGQAPINGLTDLPGFASAELAFAYDPDPTGTWFTIQTGSLPVSGGLIATWDTATLTDGDYTLRLRVVLADGSFRDSLVRVKVRNYTAAPSPSPAVTPSATAALQIPTAIVLAASPTVSAPAAPPAATPTSMPPNPAGITSAEVFAGFWRGALIVGLLVLGFGALIRLRR